MTGTSASERTEGQGGDVPGDSPAPTMVLVVIPTLNAAATLDRALSSLGFRPKAGIRVVVVDGGSSDATRQVTREAAADFIPGPYPRATARRVGAASRRSKFLLFLDSDQVASPHLIDACLSLAKSSGAGAICIPEVDEAAGFWASCRRIDRRLSRDPEISYPRFISTQEYWRAGGHNSSVENFMEDRALFLRLRAQGTRIAEVDQPVTNVLGKVNPVVLGRKGARAASDAREYYRENANSGEGLRAVIYPRVRRLLTAGNLRDVTVPGLLGLPAYWLVVYGPRLIAAGIGRWRA